MFEDLNPPELTPAQEESLKAREAEQEARIQQEIERRAIDPEFIVDALSICLKDYPSTGIHLAEFLLNHGDMGIHRANVKLDVLDWIEYKVRQDAERGML